MLAPLLATALALQAQSVPIADPGGDEDAISAAGVLALPSMGRYLVPHVTGATTVVDLAGGASVSSGDQLYQATDAVVTPGGSTALIVDRGDRVWFFDASSGAFQGSLDPQLDRSGAIDVDSTGTRAIVSENCADSNDVAVIDLATRTLERVIQPGGTYSGCENGFFFAADDVTIVRARRRALVGFDVQTGVLVGSTPFSTQDTRAVDTLVSADRSTAYVVCQRGIAGPTPSISVEVFDLPGLTPRAVLPLARGVLSAAAPTIDDAATRLAFRTTEGSFVADLTTGAVRRLTTDSRPGDSVYPPRVSPDGQRVLVTELERSRVFDANTGAELGDVPFAGSRRLVVCPRASRGSTFVLARRDRLVVIDAAPSSPVLVDDVSSGAGDEIDGPFELALLGDGRRAVLSARGSDTLHEVDLRTRSIGRRVALARAPVDVAVDDAGDVLVAHREGRRVSVVDGATWTLRSEIPLSFEARQIDAVPGANTAWVLLENDATRALVEVDTSGAGAVLAVIPIGGSSDLPDEVDSVRYDFLRNRAYVVDAGAGRIDLVDLTGGAITGTAPFRPGRLVRTSLAPGGDRVVVVSSDNEVKAFDVGPNGLSLAWMDSCVPSVPGAEGFAGLVELDGGAVVHVGDFQWNTCFEPRLIQVSTGLEIPWTASPIPAFAPTIVDGSETIDVRYGSFMQRRWDGQTLDRRRSTGAPFGAFAGPLLRDPDGLQTVCIGSNFPNDDLVFVDFAALASTVACAPTVPNSLGVDAELALEGGALAGGPLVATTSGLQPGGMPSLLLVAESSAPPRLVPGGIGSICLGGEVGRFVQQIQFADSNGQARVRVETASLPLSSGAVFVVPGETWTFQTWYRDGVGGAPSSHFSDAVTVSFE